MKNKKIDILSITSQDLKNGVYKKIIPEYYALKEATENNPWHLNQNVFDHVVAVFKGLETTFEFDFLRKKTKEKIKEHLKKQVGNHTRRELLIISTLLHDIAKTIVLIKDSNGFTMCPAHEIIGGVMVGKFAKRFNLNKKAQDCIKKIVHFHGFTNDILTLVIRKKNLNKHLELFKEAVEGIHIELFLLMYADILGSDLKKAIPEEYKNRTQAIISLLDES